MISLDHKNYSSISQSIWKDHENRLIFFLSIASSIMFFALFKTSCPYPYFISESYTYLGAAQNNEAINIRPIGYSMFLRFLSGFTSSHFFLTLLQFLILQTTIFYLVVTAKCLFNIPTWVCWLLSVLGIFNPLSIYISNLISSDAMFASLSLLWFIQILWMIHYPSKRILITHPFILIAAFSINYGSWFYIFISSLIIATSAPAKLSKGLKIMTVTLIIVLNSVFIFRTVVQFYQTTGKSQFSPLYGWQISNNALLAYENSEKDALLTTPAEFKTLHSTVNQTQRKASRHSRIQKLDNYYLWNENSPLRLHMHKNSELSENEMDDFKKWALMGPLYRKYGYYLIMKNPVDFLKYFISPNIKDYFLPSNSFSEKYNVPKTTLDQIAIFWFGLKDHRLSVNYTKVGQTIVKFMPQFVLIINIVSAATLIFFILAGGLAKCSLLNKKVFWVIILIWSYNFVFNIVASPIVLRQLTFPLVVTYTACLLYIGLLLNQKQSKVVHRHKEPIKRRAVV